MIEFLDDGMLKISNVDIAENPISIMTRQAFLELHGQFCGPGFAHTDQCSVVTTIMSRAELDGLHSVYVEKVGDYPIAAA